MANSYPAAGTCVPNLRLHPRAQIDWRGVALAAVLRLGDQPMQTKHQRSLGIAYRNLILNAT